MTDNRFEADMSEKLWVQVKLREATYAIDSAYVESIFLLEQPLTTTDESDHVNLGIIQFRNYILPIIDLRGFLGMKSVIQEENEFEVMLDQRKKDHIHWVDELKRCLQTGEKFRLATDPHQCAFGKWYDSYKPSSQTVAFHLRKIDEPHQRLHESAVETFSCARHCSDCEREECLQVSLSNGADRYMPQVVQLLEEAKRVFQESYRRMVVVIADGDTKFGLMVDEVRSVEALPNVLTDHCFGMQGENRSVTHIAANKSDSDLVLMLNLEKVFRSCAAMTQASR